MDAQQIAATSEVTANDDGDDEFEPAALREIHSGAAVVDAVTAGGEVAGNGDAVLPSEKGESCRYLF